MKCTIPKRTVCSSFQLLSLIVLVAALMPPVAAGSPSELLTLHEFMTLPFYEHPNMRVQQAWIYTWGAPHGGIDYIKGTIDGTDWQPFDVLAAADGWAYASSGGELGDYVWITHITEGALYYTYYGHLGAVEPGIPSASSGKTIWVQRGQKIGVAGDTGTEPGWIHLHFQVKNVSGTPLDPYDLYSIDRSLYYPGGANYTNMGEDRLFTDDPPLYGADDYLTARGLRFLRQNQNADGGWGVSQSSTGITALAALAFLNHGYDEHDPTDTDGDNTPDVQEAILFLLNHYDAGLGRFWGDAPWGEPAYTYDTSIALLVLHAADRTNDPHQYAEEVSAAKDYLLSIQSTEINGYLPDNPHYGGWGYPRTNWSDLSNTQWAVMALNAAYDYLDLPLPNREDPTTWTYKVLRYADSLQLADGGFDYQQDWFGQSVGSMTHAGIWVNLLAGRDVTAERVQQALDWVQTSPNWSVTENPGRGSAALFYYYVTMAKALTLARKANLTVDNVTLDWYRELYTELDSGAHQQQLDGSWYNANAEEWEGDTNLVTSYALLALETRLLPCGVPLAIVIKLHSPADLHLYDQLGRHTGMNYETGTIELDIPGASYSLGDTQTITLTQPVAGNYSVQWLGTAEGDYEVEIIALQDAQVVDTDTYAGTIIPNQVQGSFLTATAMEGALTIFSTSPQVLPVMEVQPSNLVVRAEPGSIATDTLVITEMQGQLGIESISVFASNLTDGKGNVIPESSLSFEPHTFDVASGGSQSVTVTVALDSEVPRSTYSGIITVESLNAGARALPVSIQTIRLYLPLVMRN